MTAGHVYAIQSPENRRHVKLGLSANPQARLKQLQTGNPHRLELIWTCPCPDMSRAERAFHQAFDKYRIAGGEWFDFRPIDNPEHLAAYLDILAFKYLSPDLPPGLRRQLDGLEAFIDSPAKFLSSQADVDTLIEKQFPRLKEFEDDPEAAERYIRQNLKQD
jgi:hypothetical protein